MEVSGESWRAYYSSAEHPLSAATSAVLGAVADDGQGQPIEYYKLPPLAQDTHLNLHKDAKLVDVWPWVLHACLPYSEPVTKAPQLITHLFIK